ncbi:MAG TPA: serine/threonine-protein kinase [Polyangia bacterium]
MNPALDRDRTQFGKYTLVERLGRGGMADVWKAKISGPAGFQRTLVIKRILPHLVEDEHFKAMFVSEARLSARLNHANIVQVFELGDVEGELYLAMEYVRGRDLVNVVRAQLMHSLPPPGMGAFVARELCRALAYAHALTDDDGVPLRLIHRDVSPSNVMISFDGAVKLLDFGIAKAMAEVNENRTVTGTLKGKFGYMSPEQVEGKEVDHRSDLFAAGIVLHEILTGKRLFKGASDLQTIAMVRDARVEPPSLFNPAVPRELDDICLKALARDPDQRWRGCDEMAVALDEVVHSLKWGPERLASMQRELFPDEPSHSNVVHMGPLAPTAVAARSELTVGALRRHEWRRRAAIAAAALMVVGLVWLVAAKTMHRSEPAVATVKPVVMEPEPAPVVAPPAPPKTVLLRVVTSPSGADVYVGGEPESRGKTPLQLTMPRSSETLRLAVKLHGYEPQTAELVPDSDSRLQMTLVKAAAPRPVAVARPRPAPKPAASKPRPKPPVPDLHRGDVVDPFAR